MKKYSLIVPPMVGEPFTIKNWGKAHSFIEVNGNLVAEPKQNEFHLSMKSKAKRTDVIREFFTPYGLLVSHKLKLILEKFKLPEHRFYPSTIVHKNKEYEYHWLQINTPLRWFPIDAKKSIVSEEFDHNTFAYQPGVKPTKGVEPTYATNDVGLKSEIWLYKDQVPYDLFRDGDLYIRSRCCTMPFVISQELKAALIENKITGIGIIDANIQAE
jgi:hypothetical protein